MFLGVKPPQLFPRSEGRVVIGEEEGGGREEGRRGGRGRGGGGGGGGREGGRGGVLLEGVEDGGDAGGTFEVPGDVVAQAGGGGEDEDGVGWGGRRRRSRGTRRDDGAGAGGDGSDGGGGKFGELREGLALRMGVWEGREGGMGMRQADGGLMSLNYARSEEGEGARGKTCQWREGQANVATPSS